MRKIGVKREAIKTEDATIRIRCRDGTRYQILNKSSLPRSQWLAERVCERNDVRLWTIFADKSIPMPRNLLLKGACHLYGCTDFRCFRCCRAFPA